MKKKILVIKHGALGDIIFAQAAFKALRDHHQNDRLILLTSSPYLELAKKSGYFDEIWVDDRKKFLKSPAHWWTLLRKIKKEQFERIYDLQRSHRTQWYFRLMKLFFKSLPEWSGTAKGASHHYDTPSLYEKHILDHNKEQLAIAGIHNIQPPSLEWMKPSIQYLHLPQKYFLLVPGCSRTQPHKRWPAEKYGEIAKKLIAQKITPVILGSDSEKEATETIQKACPKAISLLGKTTLFQLPELARSAQGALGGDTGPMHMIVLSQCPSLMLFSYSSNPQLCGPQDGISQVIFRHTLADVKVEEVWKKLRFR